MGNCCCINSELITLCALKSQRDCARKNAKKSTRKIAKKIKERKGVRKAARIGLSKKTKKLTQENLRKNNNEATAIHNRYNHYLQGSQSEEHAISDSHDDDSTHSMVINENNGTTPPPKEEEEDVAIVDVTNKNFEKLSLSSTNSGGGYGRLRSP